MKALTLWQPWASLIALGHKTIETRSWKAPDSLIGQRIAIHAAKKRPASLYPRFVAGADTGGSWFLYEHNRELRDRMPLPLGAVVGTAVLADCVPMVGPADRYSSSHLSVSRDKDGGPHLFIWRFDDTGPDAELLDCEPVHDQRPFGHFEPGRWAWLLTDAERFDKPIPATGRQGVWNWQ